MLRSVEERERQNNDGFSMGQKPKHDSMFNRPQLHLFKSDVCSIWNFNRSK